MENRSSSDPQRPPALPSSPSSRPRHPGPIRKASLSCRVRTIHRRRGRVRSAEAPNPYGRWRHRSRNGASGIACCWRTLARWRQAQLLAPRQSLHRCLSRRCVPGPRQRCRAQPWSRSHPCRSRSHRRAPKRSPDPLRRCQAQRRSRSHPCRSRSHRRAPKRSPDPLRRCQAQPQSHPCRSRSHRRAPSCIPQPLGRCRAQPSCWHLRRSRSGRRAPGCIPQLDRCRAQPSSCWHLRRPRSGRTT